MLLLCLYVKKSLMMPNFFCYEKCILQNPPFPHSHEKFSLVNIKNHPSVLKADFLLFLILKLCLIWGAHLVLSPKLFPHISRLLTKMNRSLINEEC